MTVLEKPRAPVTTKIPVIDTDFHPMLRQHEENVLRHLPQKWRSYISKYGLGLGGNSFSGSPAQRHPRPGADPEEYLNNDMKGSINKTGLPDHEEELRSRIEAFMARLKHLPERVRNYFLHPCVQYAAGL